MKRLIVLLLVSSATMFAGAANWVQANSNPEKGVYMYVDTESISTQGNYKQSFIKLITITDKKYFITLNTYDCKSNPKRVKPTYITEFDLEGVVLQSFSVKAPYFVPALPDSLFESSAKLVCDY